MKTTSYIWIWNAIKEVCFVPIWPQRCLKEISVWIMSLAQCNEMFRNNVIESCFPLYSFMESLLNEHQRFWFHLDLEFSRICLFNETQINNTKKNRCQFNQLKFKRIRLSLFTARDSIFSSWLNIQHRVRIKNLKLQLTLGIQNEDRKKNRKLNYRNMKTSQLK